MDQIVQYGKVSRGRIGVAIQDITPDLAQAMALSVNQGAVVSQVEPNSPAAQAGIKAGDVVTEVDGHAIRSSSDLRNRVGLARVGTEVKLGLLRDGQKVSVTAKVGEAPAKTAEGAPSGSTTTKDKLEGATLRDLGGSGNDAGVAVAEVEQGSPAWRSGLRPGDVIVGVNRKRVHSVKEFEIAAGEAPSVLALNVKRGDSSLFVVVR